jgi:hypothetical protein
MDLALAETKCRRIAVTAEGDSALKDAPFHYDRDLTSLLHNLPSIEVPRTALRPSILDLTPHYDDSSTPTQIDSSHPFTNRYLGVFSGGS